MSARSYRASRLGRYNYRRPALEVYQSTRQRKRYAKLAVSDVAFGSANTASSARGSLDGTWALEGKATSEFNVRPAPTVSEEEAVGSANTASDAVGILGIPRAVSGKASAASGFDATFTGALPVSGQASAAFAVEGVTSLVTIAGQANGSSAASGSISRSSGPDSNAPNSFLAAGSLTYDDAALNGIADIVADMAGALSGGIAVRRWVILDPDTLAEFQFDINPSKGNDVNRQKRIVYQNTAAANKTLLFHHAAAQQEVTVSGTLTSQAQYEGLRDWAKKRNALVLTDDLKRKYTIYIQRFDARRVQAPDQPYRKPYTLKYLVI